MSSGSSTTGNILGAIGAVVGGIFGGPVGAAQGYAIGSSLGNALDPPKGPTQEGPRLQDKSVQTSTYGATIPRVYGTCKVAGNIFWLEGDQLKEVVKKKKSGGKGGGGGTTVKTYTYYATFAVGLCRGPISGVRRIWIGPNLIYDAGSDDLETIIAGNQNISNFEIYTGTEDQLPSARMQADKGVADTPAYRGLAYLIIKDLELTKYGNSLAQAQVNVEIVQGGQYLYSQLDAWTTNPATFYRLGGCDNSGRVNWQFAESSIIKRGARQSGASSSSVLFDATGYQQFRLFETSTPSADAYAFFDPVLTDGKWIIRINGNEYRSTVLPPSSTYAESGGEFITYSGNSIYWSSGLDSTYADVGKQMFGPLNIGFGVAGVFVGPEGLCLFRLNGSVIDVYSVSQGSGSPLLSMIGSFPSAPSYGANPKYYWGISSGVYVLSLYDSEFAVIQSIAVDAFTFNSVVTINNDAVSCFDNGSPDQLRTYAITYDDSPALLSEITESESVLSNLIQLADINASSLTDSVVGYRVASAGSIRNGIEPLRGAWPFDVLQDGYQVKFRARGNPSIATVDIGELGVQEQIRESREMDSQIARKVVVKYLDKARDYDVNEQFDQRENTEAVNTLSLDLPVVLSETEAKRVAQKLLYLYWLERSDFTFTLPPSYHYLQPSDVVTIVAPDVTYDLRIGTVKYQPNGQLELTAKANNASVYASIADTDGGLIPPVTIPLDGDSIGLLLDIPVIDETLQNTPGYVGYMTGETSGWPGGVYWITNDGGQTWTDLQGFIGKGTFGTVRDVLSANSGLLIQIGGSITVDLYSGELEGVTQAQMLNGMNYAAYGDAGRWEIIRFQNASLNADGSYALSTFIRGDRGTEWATGLHQAGDMFCLLDDPDGAFILTNTASIGVTRKLRAVTNGADIDSADDESFTYTGANLECYSPSHAKGVRDGSSNLEISWIRRTRIGGEWRSNVDASLGEVTEAYEIDVMDGATVKRTINSATQSATYTDAQQTTDFGAPQSSVTVRIYQMSATVGRGYPLEVTL